MLYDRWVGSTVVRLLHKLGSRHHDRELWARCKEEYAASIQSYLDSEFYKTFFSSITRRVFDTVGVDPRVEFIALDVEPTALINKPVASKVYLNRGSLRHLLDEALVEFAFAVPYRDVARSIRTIAEEVERFCAPAGGSESIRRVELLRPVFYQNTRAYLVGRILGDDWVAPLVIALKNTEAGILVDAVIMEENQVSILFGFTRSYFHVDLETVGDAVVFLKSLLPHKPIDELYTVLGRAKQGKTERYRHLFRHLEHASDTFVPAPGDRGMVMVVFTPPSYDLVFKIIRDRFPEPKNVTRADVMERYQLVFRHDRAGRLVDAQEFRHLEFPRERFAPELLEELLGESSRTARIEGCDVVIDHLYIERRLYPLNLYLRHADRRAAQHAVLDYGRAIRDLAMSNIFPGDLLLKNFGVTRNGRVIFYDYDELCLVADCNFRDLPQAASYEDELRAEAWFYVGPNDVFPEQFDAFLGLDEELLALFLEVHGELLTAEYWRQLKRRLRAGDVLEVVPYHLDLLPAQASEQARLL